MTQPLRCCEVSRQSSLNQCHPLSCESESQYHKKQIITELQPQQQLVISTQPIQNAHECQFQLSYTQLYRSSTMQQLIKELYNFNKDCFAEFQQRYDKYIKKKIIVLMILHHY